MITDSSISFYYLKMIEMNPFFIFSLKITLKSAE